MSALPRKADVPHPRALFMGEAVGAVILGPAKTVALSGWACARERGASGEALGFSQVFPGWRTGAWWSRASSGLDWRLAVRRLLARRQDAARRLVAPRQYPSPSAVLAAG